MLWYKAWVESRVRFSVAAVVLLLACAVSIVWQNTFRSLLAAHSTPLQTYVSYIYRVWYQGFLRTLFMVFAVVLGMGGLMRERELGTAGFTLALPVSRVRLMIVRAATGLAEIAALAAVPAVVGVALSPLVGESYPLAQAVEFSALWSAGGAALFAVAFLASALWGGEYTAFVVAEAVLFAHTVSTQFLRLAHPATRPYLFTLQEVMSGVRMPYFDPKTRLLIGAFPAAAVTALMLLACALIAFSLHYTIRKDF